MEFVICDDDKFFRKNVISIIESVLMNTNDDYKIKEFESYNKDFEKLIDKKNTKIYILDIEINNSISGIDIARKIRKNDWNSIIIIVTSHNELSYQVMKAKIMLLDFVSKFDDCNNELKKAIIKSVDLIGKRKILKIENKGISYIINLKDIMFIEKDTIDRKCIINTSYGKIVTNKTLIELEKELGNNFFLSHRSCLININNIRKIDWKNNIIYFDDIKTDLLARDKKKELKEYVNI